MKKKTDFSDAILYGSDQAAELKTVQCWVTRDGFLTLDEHHARLIGSTHNTCKCGQIVCKPFKVCPKCEEKEYFAKFSTFKEKDYSGEPVAVYSYIENGKQVKPGWENILWNEGQIFHFAESMEMQFEDLKLVYVTPMGIPHLEADEIYADYAWEDWKPDCLPAAVHAAIEHLNLVMEEAGCQGYELTETAVSYPQEMIDRFYGKHKDSN